MLNVQYQGAQIACGDGLIACEWWVYVIIKENYVECTDKRIMFLKDKNKCLWSDLMLQTKKTFYDLR